MGLWGKFKRLLRANYQQILFVFLAFLAMVLVSYFYVAGIVRGQMLTIGEETMNTMQTAVSASLSETELTFANMTQTAETMLTHGQPNSEILAYLEETNGYFDSTRSPLPDFMKVYGYIRGEFLDGSGWVPPADYVPPERPWYTGADAAGGSIYFSEPYVDAETGGMCISFSQTVFDQFGNAHGILAIDLNLTRITNYVGGQQIANNGYGVLLSDTLHFTSHKDPALIGVSMWDAGGDYPRLAALIEEGSPVAAERFTDYDGTDSIAFFRTIFIGWRIGVVTPRASYYAQVYIMAAVLGALGFVLMAALTTTLVRTRAAKMRSDEENRSKSSFLARMSHEMRTPMNAIIGMTNIAQNTDDPARIHASLDKISDAASHLLGVINDVLDMSKIEAGKLELSETDFLLAKLVEQVTTVTEFKMAEKHQTLAVDIADDVPVALVADQQRLAQVVLNLLSNANKFTPDGGHIALSVQRAPSAEGCMLQFSVADNGIGIPPEQQARLFQSFEQADGSISRRYGGTGLGLSISKTIVEMMGGTIWVASAPGQGSTFSFTVQVGIGRSDVLLAAEQARPENPDFIGRHILLAEDVEVNREILAALLEDTGVDITSAENGQEAVDLFAAAPARYDLIFMDIHMPEMDGYEATRRIRAMAEPRGKTVPIVAMTANVFREDIEKCLAAGMNDHVGKPIDRSEVLDKMHQYMPQNPAEGAPANQS